MDLKNTRTRLFGNETFQSFENANILLLGVGGVGSYCLDCLYRSGVRKITIVDFDVYDESNQNRQMHSEKHCGESKVFSLQKYYPGIIAIHEKISPDWVKEFDFNPYDLVLDAIDDFSAKISVIEACSNKIISSVGSAKRIDPTMYM